MHYICIRSCVVVATLPSLLIMTEHFEKTLLPNYQSPRAVQRFKLMVILNSSGSFSRPYGGESS